MSRDWLAELLQAHPLHRMLGITRADAGAGRAALELVVGPDQINQAGVLHGTVIYTAAELAAFAALHSLLSAGEVIVTHDLHVSVLTGAKLGDTVRVESRVLRKGGRVAFMDSEVLCGDTLLARATVTKTILPRR